MSIDQATMTVLLALLSEGRTLAIRGAGYPGTTFEIRDTQGHVLRADRASAAPLLVLLQLASRQVSADLRATPRKDRERRAALRRLDRELSKIHKAYRAELRRGTDASKPETEGPESDASGR